MSPSLRPVWMFSSPATAARQRASSACVESCAHAPGVHSIFSALRPCIAAQVLSATTATPAARLRARCFSGLGPAIGTMARTPRIFFAAESSSDYAACRRSTGSVR